MNAACRKLCLVSIVVFGLAAFTAPGALGQVAGPNVNMVSGTQWPTGDPFLQRQNEPSMAVSTRNPLHILAGANDYRTVDLELALTGGEETGDAWLGLFKSFDGGLTWRSTLLPGCSQLVSQCADNGMLGGRYQAASDPVVRAGTNGMFYYAGLAFNRATSPITASSVSSIFVARFNDLNNNENADPITYIDTHIVANGSSSQFVDKPSLAVDIPRSGATTCSFTAKEPGVGPNGGNLSVPQSFAAGNVYIAYTEFLNPTKANSTPTHLMFSRSTDCGVTWNTPVQINTGTTTSQGAAIAVNAINGNVYVAWRQFGSSGIPDAIMAAVSTNAGRTFGAPVRISAFQPFDQGTTNTSFRTNAYPAITTDMFGFVYAAFSARGLTASGDARIVAAGSIDGTHWTPAIMVDNPSPNAQTNPSGRGHQIMPAITFANGRLTLLYYDLRLDHYAAFYAPSSTDPSGYIETLFPAGELAPPSPAPNRVFTQYIDDAGLTMRRHTLDLRVLQLGIFPTVVLGPSVLVSQYQYGCCVNPNLPDIQQFKFNVPNLPLFAQGSTPFFGDYIDVVPSPWFLPSGNTWRYNFMPSVNPLFHATWTDNRDVVPPADGNWMNYTPALPSGAGSVFQPGNTVAACVPGNEGMRNQNIYTAQITGGLVVGAPGNAKPLGTTKFNNQTVPFQRGFAVTAQNVTAQAINVRFTIANQPVGGSASFLQLVSLTSLDVTIPAFSSVSRTVFVTSSNPQASVSVNVVQINGIGGSVVTNGLQASAVLNPDITNPNITNPNITNPNITNPNITNLEVTDPNITNPNITNPNITNPNITNPNITNPNITNPNITNPNITNLSATNPNITNPNITNPDITNPNITNPNITNPDITNGSIQDVIYPLTNNGNTTAAYTVKVGSSVQPPSGVLVQLIINRLYQTPTAISCQLTNETHWVTVANINNPKIYGLTDPQLGNPNITNSAPNEATVTLAPGETAYIDFRVVNPTPATTPFNPVEALTPVTIPQAIDTQTVLSNPGNPNLTPPVVYPTLAILTNTLPATDRNDAGYTVQLQAQGGKPGPRTWSIASGSLPPGIQLSSSGLVSGTATTPGTYPVSIQVADTASPANVAKQNYTINVSLTPLTEQFVTTPPDGVVGQQYLSTPLAVNGGTSPYTFTAPGLPAGLLINPATGQISGTPLAANPGGTIVTVTATDSAFPAESISTAATIRIGAPVQITPRTLPAGTIGVPYGAQLLASGGIGGLVFGLPSPMAGVLLDSNGTLTISNPQSPSISFSVSAHDAASPMQTVSANYTINFAALTGLVTFVRQPATYAGGQPNPDSPVQVHVADATNAPIAGANVTLSFNGTPPCSTAVLSGTLTQQTNATGNAFFTDISVDRGQIGYTLAAAVQSASAISNPFTVSGFCGAGNLSVARDNGTSTLLNDGTVLVAGGQAGEAPSNAADLYNASTGTFATVTGGLQVARYSHTATILQDGTVLIAGGQITPTPPSTNPFTNTAEIYNPLTGTFTLLANGLNFARSQHTATLLGDGSVLIAGGMSQSGSPTVQAEIYDPAEQTFTAVGSSNVARLAHTATLLPNGQVLIASGLDNSAELYNPAKQTFTITGSLNTARQNATATLLANGQVLIAGGLQSGAIGIGTAELYNPAAGTFALTSGQLNTPRGAQAATILPNGTVLLAGGYNCPPPSCTNPILGSAELYDPSAGVFSNTGSLRNARWLDTAVLLNDGTILIAGGFSGNSATATAERYYSTAPLGPMFVTTTTPAASPTTTSYSNSTAFNGAASNLSTIGFNGILPPAPPATYQGFNPLVVSGASFSTPNLNTNVNVTSASFYAAPYPADFIVDSANDNSSNSLVITLPTPAYAVGLTYGALGFRGASSGNITLSNGFVLPLSSLPAEGQTQLAGFVSNTPITSLTYNVTNDDWVGLNIQFGSANVMLPNAVQGTPYAFQLLEQGGVGTLAWTQIGGELPPGVTLSSAGLLHGTPTSAGVYRFTVSVTDSSSPQKMASSGFLTITVTPQLTITTTGLPNGIEGVFYSATILTSGGTAPISFSVTQATFPPGLTMAQPPTTSTSDTFSGTPTQAGVYNFSESAADSGNPQQVASQNYTVTIFPQPPGGLIGSPQGQGIITLTWTASPSADVVGYRIRRGLSSGNYNTVINVGNTTQYEDTGLTSGTTYFYVVSAVSASGVESAVTNEVAVTSP